MYGACINALIRNIKKLFARSQAQPTPLTGAELIHHNSAMSDVRQSPQNFSGTPDIMLEQRSARCVANPKHTESIGPEGGVDHPSVGLGSSSLGIKNPVYNNGECPPQEPFRLLDLPPELRNTIYQTMVHQFTYKKRAYKIHRQSKHITSVFSQLPKALINFLLTCKLVWSELLPLLFDAFVWIVDLRYQHGQTNPFTIIPNDNWLNRGNSLAHPIDNSIRWVQFKLNFRVAKTVEERGHVQREARYVHWNAQVRLTTGEVGPVDAKVFTTGYWGGEREFDSRALRFSLEEALGGTLDTIVKRKLGQGAGAHAFTCEDWKEVMNVLTGQFKIWFEGHVWNQ